MEKKLTFKFLFFQLTQLNELKEVVNLPSFGVFIGLFYVFIEFSEFISRSTKQSFFLLKENSECAINFIYQMQSANSV